MTTAPMIALVTDFGPGGPYVGQMTAAAMREAPGVPVVALLSDAPRFDPRASAYLLAALASDMPDGTVFLCVVDPGVGGARRAIAVRAGGLWFIGPDNGLMAIVARRAGAWHAWEIAWRPSQLSASFHGRDLFAPVAARIARGEAVPGTALEPGAIDRPEWPDDLGEVIYLDPYGNAMTGLRASTLADNTVLEAGNCRLRRARTFSDVPVGAAFWYENASGLAELSVNQGRADTALGLAVGDGIYPVLDGR